MGCSSLLLSLFSSFQKTLLLFLQQIYVKNVIQYTGQGFEVTTLRTWVSPITTRLTLLSFSCSFFLFLFVSTTIKNIIFIFDIGEPKERNQFSAMRSHNSVNKSSSSNNNNNNLDGEVIPGERCLCFRLMAFFEGWGDIFNLDVIMFCLFLFWNLFSSCKENWWKILRLAFCNKWSRKFAFCYERDLM